MPKSAQKQANDPSFVLHPEGKGLTITNPSHSITTHPKVMESVLRCAQKAPLP